MTLAPEKATDEMLTNDIKIFFYASNFETATAMRTSTNAVVKCWLENGFLLNVQNNRILNSDWGHAWPDLFLPRGPLMWIFGNCNLILRFCPREQVGGSCGNEVVGSAPMQIPTHDDTEKQQDFKKKMYTERTQRSWNQQFKKLNGG